MLWVMIRASVTDCGDDKPGSRPISAATMLRCAQMCSHVCYHLGIFCRITNSTVLTHQLLTEVFVLVS
ncbi:hypothetical protein NP493_6339g00000 [Ridgeia piscesae]|uniref:Uncharacterized protein n=1 Tax=Ridgeia piscesae TaxID=27915 RepID=A0AAD9MQT2_RIDPI|nr:hypothetical protein NP493_6339g00000 [Ridgeia piscesae]